MIDNAEDDSGTIAAKELTLDLMGSANVLSSAFFDFDAVTVAKNLLGKILISKIGGKTTAGLVVETESYLPDNDSACHGALKKTAKNEVMFGTPGLAYVYPIHAKWCFNAVTAPIGRPSAVLIRAVQPLHGFETMGHRRKKKDFRELCRGPAKLCQAFGIDKNANGIELAPSSNLWFCELSVSSGYESVQIKSTPRIGVTSSKELELRFVISKSVYASGPKYLNR